VPPKVPRIQECVEGYLFHGFPPRFLVLRRPVERGDFWVPVSGKVETADTSFAEAIRREVLEETGIARPRRVFPLDWEVTFDGPDGRDWRLHAFGVEVEEEARPQLSEEHVAYEWVDGAEAVARLHFADNREAVSRLSALVAAERRVTGPKT